MNKNPKTKKPQAKATRGKGKAASEPKVTKKVNTPTKNEKQKKKNSATKVEGPKVTKKKTPEVKVEGPKVAKRKTAEVKVEEPKVAKRRTQAAKVEEPKVTKRKTPATKVEEPKVAKRRTQTVKVEEPVDKVARLKREVCLEKLRQYYYANRDTLCKQQNSKY